MPTSGGGTVGSLHRLAKAHWGADLDMTERNEHTHKPVNQKPIIILKSHIKTMEVELQIITYLCLVLALSLSLSIYVLHLLHDLLVSIC